MIQNSHRESRRWLGHCSSMQRLTCIRACAGSVLVYISVDLPDAMLRFGGKIFPHFQPWESRLFPWGNKSKTVIKMLHAKKHLTHTSNNKSFPQKWQKISSFQQQIIFQMRPGWCKQVSYLTKKSLCLDSDIHIFIHFLSLFHRNEIGK